MPVPVPSASIDHSPGGKGTSKPLTGTIFWKVRPNDARSNPDVGSIAYPPGVGDAAWVGDCGRTLSSGRAGSRAGSPGWLMSFVDWPINSYNVYVEKASVSNLKNNLSAYLRKVRAGHPVVIYDREVPIARLERIEAVGLGSDRLASLHAKGMTRPPLRQGSPVEILAGLPSLLPDVARLLDALRQDRSEDR
jgi:antitoxin (DNA-binding transcriptional repressor) of toxin-antitoxin stability system